MEWIKRWFCKHGDMEIIEDDDYVDIGDTTYSEFIQVKRKFMICKKCGFKRKISNR